MPSVISQTAQTDKSIYPTSIANCNPYMFVMLMKSILLPSVILLILIPPANLWQTSTTKEERNLADPFNFRYNILRRFNYARRVIASGDLAVFMDTIGLVAPKNSLPQVGPASNMYRLEWSRELERVAYEESVESSNSNKFVGKKAGPLSKEKLIGFYWVGEIIELILEVLGGIFKGFQSFIDKWMPVIELVGLVIWLGWEFPKKSPYPKSDHGKFGPTEVLMADRYEIGCYSRIAKSLCYLRQVEFTGRMFQFGASCYDCPPGSQCEFFRHEDGMYKEGNLCIINETLTNQLKEEARLKELALNATTTESLGLHADYLLPMILVLVLLLFVYRR